MLHSAFTDGNQTEGSNKQFMKLREEENAAKKRTLVDHLSASEQEYHLFIMFSSPSPLLFSSILLMFSFLIVTRYVDSMQYIRNTFLAPLRKAVESPMPMISLAELIDITSNLETLLSCHVSVPKKNRGKFKTLNLKKVI